MKNGKRERTKFVLVDIKQKMCYNKNIIFLYIMMKGEFNMLDVVIFEVRMNQYAIKRTATIEDKQLGEITTFIYANGGVEFEKNVFWVPTPRLNYITNDLEEKLNVKFQEVKVKR